MEEKIPIENIYYMLCYSWGYLKEKDIINVDLTKKGSSYSALINGKVFFR